MDKSVLLIFVFQVSDEDSTDTNTVAEDEDDINADLFDIRGVSLFMFNVSNGPMHSFKVFLQPFLMQHIYIFS